MLFNTTKWNTKVLPFIVLLSSALLFVGCQVKLVSDYDSATFEEILKIGKKVELFYGELLEIPANSRPYQKFASQYVEIETDIRSLYIRNQARALNKESTEISTITLNLWLKYKTLHAQKDGYPDGIAKLDRKRFTRLFVAAADAEASKKLDADDRDTEKDSK